MTHLRRLVASALAVAALTSLTACDGQIRLTTTSAEASPTPSPTPTFDSQFTRDGTFQSHIDVDGLDFVYTVWPTKATPRTNLWYPKGDKFFSFTFQAYDLDRDLRDKFRTKRRVFLERIEVSTATTTDSGAVEAPYRLDADAARTTFDPEPVRSRRYGMLITSPKGAFELRNQKIGDLAPDTRGLTLTFRATVHVETRARSKRFESHTVEQQVPIAIFRSDEPTEAQEIPINAN